MAGRHKPTGQFAAARWEADGAPAHSKPATHGLDMGDEGMTGHDGSDAVMLQNAHPHQAHSIGYEDSTMGTTYENHGFEAVHIKHGRRDKGAEHHPPLGLM
jgi:hypothetical protein